MSELWTAADAAGCIARPGPDDDKYTRGVLGVVAGSDAYPGAAVLTVEAALRTGVGMVRYSGPDLARTLVLQRRPEAVTAAGRVQAWVCGPGMDARERREDEVGRLDRAIADGVPLVLDAGALDLVPQAVGPVVITPHLGELARILELDRGRVAAEPARWARAAAEDLGVTVLLKGHRTLVCGPGVDFAAESAPAWTATAGAGDALAGILGALLATHAEAVRRDERMPARLAASAAVIHGLAAGRAGGGGPFTVLDLAEAVPPTVAALLSAGE